MNTTTKVIGWVEYTLTVDTENVTAYMKRKAPRSYLWYKYVFNYRFRSVERMDEYISKYIEDLIISHENAEAYKIQRKAEKKQRIDEFKAKTVVWDILVNSRWYEQTNVDARQIVDIKGSTVTIRKIGTEIQDDERHHYMSYTVKPMKDNFILDDWQYIEERKRISQRWVSFNFWGCDVRDWKRNYTNTCYA